MSRLNARLRSLVRESADPWVVAFVVDGLNVQAGDAQYRGHMQRLRQEYVDLLMRMTWQPAEVHRELVMEKVRIVNPGAAKVLKRNELTKDRIDALQKERMRLKEAEAQAAIQRILKQQFEEWQKERARSAEMAKNLDSLYREFNKEDTIDILCRLKDDEPLNRWVAIQVAQNRWEPLENFLVAALDDPAPMVRQAAQQALVKLSRGNDFGPAGPSPTATQIRTAQKHWRAYLEMQDRVE